MATDSGMRASHVTAMDPAEILGVFTGDAAVGEVAVEAGTTLRRVIASLTCTG